MWVLWCRCVFVLVLGGVIIWNSLVLVVSSVLVMVRLVVSESVVFCVLVWLNGWKCKVKWFVLLCFIFCLGGLMWVVLCWFLVVVICVVSLVKLGGRFLLWMLV